MMIINNCKRFFSVSSYKHDDTKSFNLTNALMT